MVFICLQRWQTQGHVVQGLMDTLWSAVALASQVFDLTVCLFFCHRLSLRWLCAHALCLHPEQPTMPSVTGPISFRRCAVFPHIPGKQIWSKIKKQTLPLCALLTSFGSLTFRAPTMPRPHGAVSRRRWTIRWTTSGGWSAWWCSGLLYTGITCRRRMSV